MKANQKGFSVVELLIIIVVVGLLGAVGWLVYDRQKSKTDNKETTIQTSQQKQEAPKEENKTTNKGYQAEIPSGWVTKTDITTNAQYAVPAGWGDEVKVQKFSVDENIHVGFGAPVWVRFSSSAQIWQTIDMDQNNNPTIVRAENLVSTSSVKVEDKYSTGTYTTGDGGGAQIRVLVTRDKQVIQFSLPSTCEGVICDGDKKWTFDEIKTSIPQFIKTITLN